MNFGGICSSAILEERPRPVSKEKNEKEPIASTTTTTTTTTSKTDTDKPDTAKTETDEGKLALKTDYQLNEALNMLKGLTFIESRSNRKDKPATSLKNTKEAITEKQTQ